MSLGNAQMEHYDFGDIGSGHQSNKIDDIRFRERLNSDWVWLSENIHARPLLRRLRSELAISEAQWGSIEAEKTENKQVGKLLETIRRAPPGAIECLARGLHSTKQTEAYTRLMNGRERGSAFPDAFAREHRNCIVNNLRFEGLFLSELVRHGVILEEKRQALDGIEPRIEKADKLLDAVLRGADLDRISRLAQALDKTGQSHIARVFDKKDVTDLIPEEIRERIELNQPNYIKQIRLRRIDKIIEAAAEAGVITVDQKDLVLEERGGKQKKAELLVDILKCRPVHCIHHMTCPLALGQSRGPIITSIHTTMSDGNQHEAQENRDSAIESGPETPNTPLTPETDSVSLTEPKQRFLPTSAYNTDTRTEQKTPITCSLSTASYNTDSISGSSFMISDSEASGTASYVRAMRNSSIPDRCLPSQCNRGFEAPPEYTSLDTSVSRRSLAMVDGFSDYAGNVCKHIKRRSMALNYGILKKFGMKSQDCVFYIRLHLLTGDRQQMDKEGVQRAVQQGFEEDNPTIYLKDIFNETELVDDASEDSGNPRDTDHSDSPLSLKGRNYLILGVAGSGKSTFCQHSAEQWADGQIWNDKFKLVYLLECRRLNQIIEKKAGDTVSLEDLVLNQGPPAAGQLTRDEMKSAFHQHLDETLIIFDGLDELAKWDDLNADTVPIINESDKPAEIPVLIHNIIAGNEYLLPGATFLFTSRPMDSIKPDNFQKTIRIFGFGRDEITQCLNVICEKDKALTKQALDYLDRKPHLYDFCNVPITCIMTGIVVHDQLKAMDSKKQNILDSDTLNCATDLYVSVLRKVLSSRGEEREQKTLKATISWNKDSLKKMIQLSAYGVLKKNQIQIFGRTELERFSIDKDADLKCGLLDITDGGVDSQTSEKNDICSFIHFSVQEFLAAVHVGLTWKKTDLKMIIDKDHGSHASSRKFDPLMMYLSGLLGNPKGQELLITLKPKMKAKLFAEHMDLLFCRLVDQYEGWWSKVKSKIKKNSAENSQLMKLCVIRCVAEGNAKHLVSKVDDLVLQNKDLDLRNMPGGLLPQHMPAIAFYLHESKKVKNLQMERKHGLQLMRMLNDANKDSLVPQLNRIILKDEKVLNLRNIEVDDDDLRGLEIYLLHDDVTHKVTKIDIDICVRLMRRADEDTRKRYYALFDRCALVQENEAKWDKPTGCLNLGDNTSAFSNIDVKAIVEYVAASSEKISKIVPVPVTLRMMKWIPENSSVNQVSTDDVSLANLPSIFDRCILDKIRKGRQSLKKLDLSSAKEITAEDVKGLTKYLNRTTIVSNLVLEDIGLTDDLLLILCEAINEQSCLESISLDRNRDITDAGVEEHLVPSIRNCSKIEEITLTMTGVTDKGKDSLRNARDPPITIAI